MSLRSRSIGLASAVAGMVALMLGALAPPASGATVLRFYSVSEQQAAYDPQGNLITDRNAAAQVGDRFESTHLDYVGTHKHHASSFTASDHLSCVLTGITETGGTGICDGQIAVGGSMLLAEDSAVTFAANGSLSPIPLNAGTGRFKGAKGAVTSVGVPNTANANVTITLTKT